MKELFKNVDIKKRDRIINSALEEFSKNGFEKASTNNIVKNANISKGLLFHYFGNKKELYKKLDEFVMQIITESIVENIDWSITDLFERVKQIIIIKVEVINKYPYIYDFFSSSFKGKSVEEIRNITDKQLTDFTKKVYTYNIDFSKFKENIDMKKTMTIIKWTFEKLGEELWKNIVAGNEIFDIKKIEIETESYIDTLEKVFYKEEKED
jgi:hypothetical protein